MIYTCKTPHATEFEEQEKADASSRGVIHKDVTYKSTLFRNLKMDIYEPLKRKSEKAPIYFYIHGGSWLHGEKEWVNISYKTVLRLREEGIAVVSIEYRFLHQASISAMIADCKDALFFIQDNAKVYGVDENFIGLHGHSAGANLALITGLSYAKNSSDIHFIVDEYGPTDVVRLVKENKNRPWWSYIIPNASFRKLSPIEMLHPHMPTIYIVHGEADKTVPLSQSLVFYESLKAEGANVSLTLIPKADHSYEGVEEAVVEKLRADVLAFMLEQYQR